MVRFNTTPTDIDSQLVDRVLAKDPDVMSDIIRVYKRQVYHLALELCRNHDDAEDLVQEVFIRAWKNLNSFRGDARLSTWLHRITVNLFINMTRSKDYIVRKELASFDEEYMSSQSESCLEPEHHIRQQMLEKHLEEALRKLSPAQRTAFILRHYHDMANKEIAEYMNNSEGTVKVLLFRAVRNLQKHLSFYRDDYLPPDNV